MIPDYTDKIDKVESCAIYRIPSGAVPDGTSVNINISFENIDRVRNIKNINLVLVYNDTETKVYNMNKIDGKFAFSVDIAVEKGLYFYYFEVVCQDKTEYYYKSEKLPYPDNNAKKWQITVYDKNFKTPNFFKGGIIYHIFVDRFAKSKSWEPEIRKGLVIHNSTDEIPFYKPDENGKVKNEDVYGGNLAGIIEKLDYLKELNVNIIYLSPVFEANSNHKYNTADYEKIDSMFGGDDIFDKLIEEAGKRGMKIILDGVFNHTGDDSVYFNKYGKYDSIGAYQSKESKYFDWYTFRDWDAGKDDYECWWGVKSLPSIKKDQPVFRAYICGIGGIIEKWLKRGIGGYRIDVADELSNRMLKDINKAAKETSPDSIIIGEVWEDASNKISYGQRRQYLLGNQLDSVMNYPLKEAIINYLKLGNSSFMSEVMDMITRNYPKESIDCLMNIIGTHDTMRILTALGSEKFEVDKDIMAESKLSRTEREIGTERLKAAVLMQMTLPGIPCIYYGDEAGVEGYGDPFNRRFFPWDNIDGEIHDFYKKICKIRKSSKVFVDGEYRLVKECGGLFCYKRVKHGEEIYVYVNLSDTCYDVNDLIGANNGFVSLLDGAPVKEIKANGFDIFL
ncbi:MAG: glycoside hydrolase family 13 protein [Oscillospiraceae bacterium]|nr:glycoside hydrolase family 13 protein [Oscillospiraceae bacterium]